MSNKPQFVGERVPFVDAFSEVSRGVKKFKQNQYAEYGVHPIVDQGQELIAGYSDDEAGLFNDVPAIVFGDHTRCVKYIEEPFFAGADGVKILKPKLSDNTRFWWHALKATPIENLGYSRHFKLLKAATFKTYNAADQIEIVARLDSILNQIAQANQQIEQLDQLVKSRFVEMFGDLKANANGWQVEPFEAFAIIDTHMANDLEPYADKPHIGIDSIEAGTGHLAGYRTVKEDGIISGKYPFTAEHLIYSKIRPALNKVALPNFDGVCSADAYPILPVAGKCNRVFLAEAMRSRIFLDHVLPLSGRAQMPKVNKNALRSFEMPVPPMQLQDSFASFVSQVDKSRFVAQQQIEKLQTLYDSLAQDYFG